MATLNLKKTVLRGTAAVLIAGSVAWAAVSAWNYSHDADVAQGREDSTALIGVASAPVPEGNFSVEASPNGYMIRAEDVSRFLVLQELATLAKFNLVDNAQVHPLISLQVDDVSLEEALARILEGSPYSVLYEVVRMGRDTIITQVELEPGSSEQYYASLGVSEGSDESTNYDRTDENPGKDTKQKAEKKERKKRIKKGKDGEPDVYEMREVVPMSAQDLAQAMVEREVLIQEHRQENLNELVSGDDEQRKLAVALLDPEQVDDLYRLADRLTYDAEAPVRAAAAWRLSFGDPEISVPTLVTALNDPSSEVVATAVKGIGYAGSAANISDIRPLLDSDNEEVAAAAEDAIQLLRDVQR